MTRRLALVLIGVALMIGLYLYDRDNRSETVIAANVVSVEERDENAGPQTWHITAQGPDGPITLEPLQARPELVVGDGFCVTRITRMGRADEYRRSNAAQTC